MTKWILVLACVLSSCRSQPSMHSAPPPDAPAGIVAAPAFEMVPLSHASADEVASLLRPLAEADPAAAGRVKVLADARTNSVLVQAPKEAMPRLLAIVAKLDVRAEPRTAAKP
jgi:type II secretory pathway component GspD/PulD (secretin)